MYKQPSSTRVHDEYIFDSVYLEWRDPVTEPPLHFFTLSKCIQNIHTRYQQPTTLGMNMPIPESRNPRLVSRLGASRSSCNSKDPPESGSRGIPDSREALPSFSEYRGLYGPPPFPIGVLGIRSEFDRNPMKKNISRIRVKFLLQSD